MKPGKLCMLCTVARCTGCKPLQISGLVNTICKDIAQRAYFLSMAIEVMWKCVQKHFTLKQMKKVSMIYDVASGLQKNSN